MSKKRKHHRRKKSFFRSFFNTILGLSIVIVLAFVIRTYVAVPVIISGSSMAETYNDGDIVVATKFDYLFGKPQNGDVVLCGVDARDGMYVKRVIGIPGDEVVIANGTLTVNGKAVNEYYVTYPSDDDFTVTLADDEYMVMGDNREVSYDSREPEMGMLSAKDFIGKVRVRVWPFGNAQ